MKLDGQTISIEFKDVMEYIEKATSDEIEEIQETISDMDGYIDSSKDFDHNDIEEYIDNAWRDEIQDILQYIKSRGYSTNDDLFDGTAAERLSLASKMELEELLITFFNTHKFG